MTALSVTSVTMQFGGVLAVDDVTLSLDVGERRVVLGPNGAGKTTLFNIIGGQLAPTAGRVDLFGQEVTREPPHRRAARGLTRTFQITNLFPNLTVRENVLLAVQALDRAKYAMHRPAFGYPHLRRRTDELLAEWALADEAETLVKTLSYGSQRQLEIVMALANRPRLLLLDEPTAGLSVDETRAVTQLIAGLPRDVTVLLIEHDMDVAFEVADWFTVLNQGAMVADGPPGEMRNNAKIQEIYFGAAHGGPSRPERPR